MLLFFVFDFGMQVIFEGVRGQGYRGDIAIDDVQFTVGGCPVLPSKATPVNPWTTPKMSTVPSTTAPTSGMQGSQCLDLCEEQKLKLLGERDLQIICWSKREVLNKLPLSLP